MKPHLLLTLMFAQAHFPHTLDPEQLDHYLEKGWFRMGQTIFTTNFLNFNDQLYSALWLRIDLRKYTESNNHKKLRRSNASFLLQIKPATLTSEKEDMYKQYKKNISFEASPSLNHLMFGSAGHNVYNSLEITLHDREKLIACGFFDLGKQAAAGISSFYDPAYRKFSLGKYLIYEKINYCKEAGLDFFYPGYFVSGYRFFDYKLGIGGDALEFFDVATKEWLPIAAFEATETPIARMQRKLEALRELLAVSGIRSEILKYEFFDANILIDSEKASLFDFPIFIQCPDMVDAMMIPIVFDIRDNRYHMVKCGSLWSNDIHPGTPGTYSAFLLRVVQELYQTEKASQMMLLIAGLLKKQSNI